MLTWLKDSEEDRITEADLKEENRTLRILMLAVMLVSIVATLGLLLISAKPIQFITGGVLTGILVLSYIALQRGFTAPAKFLVPFCVLTAITVFSLNANGIHDASIPGLVAITVFSSLTMGKRGAILFGVLGALIILAIGIAEITQNFVNPVSQYTGLDDILVISATILGVAVAQYLLISQLNQRTAAMRKYAEQQIQANAELSALKTNLEERIAERTTELQARTDELETINRFTAKSARQFEAVSEIARAISSIHELDELLKKITLFISTEFGFYHVGIFLLDDNKVYAILAAANSPGGQRMLEQKHRMKVGEQGIVGHVAADVQLHVAMDTNADSIFYNNPNLPETRAEMALPLIENNQVVGVLDIQSIEVNAFSAQDISALTALADLVSIAIENSRLYEENQRALEEAESVTRQYVRAEWNDIAERKGYVGYMQDFSGGNVIEQRIDKKPIRQAINKGQIYIGEDERKIPSLAVPIKLRDQVIGVINISTPGKKRWNADEIDVAKAIAERLAISAENARLFEETTERAERERTVSEITTKIRSTNDPNEMLAIAVAELKQALKVQDVRISPVDQPPATETPAK